MLRRGLEVCCRPQMAMDTVTNNKQPLWKTENTTPPSKINDKGDSYITGGKLLCYEESGRGATVSS